MNKLKNHVHQPCISKVILEHYNKYESFFVQCCKCGHYDFGRMISGMYFRTICSIVGFWRIQKMIRYIWNNISTDMSLCPYVRLYVRPSVTLYFGHSSSFVCQGPNKVIVFLRVILFRCPGEASKYPRSGYFLVCFMSKIKLKEHNMNETFIFANNLRAWKRVIHKWHWQAIDVFLLSYFGFSILYDESIQICFFVWLHSYILLPLKIHTCKRKKIIVGEVKKY